MGKTPLVLVAESASTEENEKIARIILQNGTNPIAGAVNPLMAAIREKNYRVMRVLHEYGVRADDLNPGDSPVGLALQYNDPRLLEEILSWKNIQLDFTATDFSGRNLFHMIAINQDLKAYESVMSRALGRHHKEKVKE